MSQLYPFTDSRLRGGGQKLAAVRLLRYCSKIFSHRVLSFLHYDKEMSLVHQSWQSSRIGNLIAYIWKRLINNFKQLP